MKGPNLAAIALVLVLVSWAFLTLFGYGDPRSDETITDVLWILAVLALLWS